MQILLSQESNHVMVTIYIGKDNVSNFTIILYIIPFITEIYFAQVSSCALKNQQLWVYFE